MASGKRQLAGNLPQSLIANPCHAGRKTNFRPAFSLPAGDALLQFAEGPMMKEHSNV
jgi:hypothetical protein